MQDILNEFTQALALWSGLLPSALSQVPEQVSETVPEQAPQPVPEPVLSDSSVAKADRQVQPETPLRQTVASYFAATAWGRELPSVQANISSSPVASVPRSDTVHPPVQPSLSVTPPTVPAEAPKRSEETPFWDGEKQPSPLGIGQPPLALPLTSFFAQTNWSGQVAIPRQNLGSQN